VEALRQYQREYDEDKKAFRKTPLHNWASHPADAFRMLAVAERRKDVDIPVDRRDQEIRAIQKMVDQERTRTLDQLWEAADSRSLQEVRI
jgi:hypothetical protein